VYNSTKLSIIGYLLFYINYRYELYSYWDLKNIKNIIANTNNKA